MVRPGASMDSMVSWDGMVSHTATFESGSGKSGYVPYASFHVPATFCSTTTFGFNTYAEPLPVFI
jgi:hypothetical protein